MSEENKVAHCIYKKEAPHREILEALHHHFLSKEGVWTKLSYGLPFYGRNKYLCYVNASKRGWVEVVFWFGDELLSASSLLSKKKRKRFVGIMIEGALTDELFQEIDNVMNQAIVLDASRNASGRN